MNKDDANKRRHARESGGRAMDTINAGIRARKNAGDRVLRAYFRRRGTLEVASRTHNAGIGS